MDAPSGTGEAEPGDAAGVARTTEDAGVQLVLDLVAEVPGFEGTYEWHISNEHEVLDHLFFWEVVQDTVLSYLGQGEEDGPDWRAVLAFLEKEFRRRVPGAVEVIGTSFLHRLPYEGQPGFGIAAHLGPAMTRMYLTLRPWCATPTPASAPDCSCPARVVAGEAGRRCPGGNGACSDR
ncbi:hypothetical protein AB0O57_10915 [Streptomyces sp. NPDC091201]|uniref:hypothetical protein n=1 Tax=Streptomyces sp. NPDC091201 TaxID=3155190 RepID=UPI003446C3F4